jgi:hypothetical protein
MCLSWCVQTVLCRAEDFETGAAMVYTAAHNKLHTGVSTLDRHTRTMAQIEAHGGWGNLIC